MIETRAIEEADYMLAVLVVTVFRAHLAVGMWLWIETRCISHVNLRRPDWRIGELFQGKQDHPLFV